MHSKILSSLFVLGNSCTVWIQRSGGSICEDLCPQNIYEQGAFSIYMEGLIWDKVVLIAGERGKNAKDED